jgi:GNAT superfamily N-acetyltransferase
MGHRGKGIAKNLLKNIEKWVLENKGSSIILGTSEIQKNAFKFWTSNGFNVEKTNLSENGFKVYSLKKIIKP